MPTFDDFIAEIEAEARAEGSEAVAELETFRLHFSLARPALRALRESAEQSSNIRHSPTHPRA